MVTALTPAALEAITERVLDLAWRMNDAIAIHEVTPLPNRPDAWADVEEARDALHQYLVTVWGAGA